MRTAPTVAAPSQTRTDEAPSAILAHLREGRSMYDRHDLRWDGNRLRMRSGRLLAIVVPDPDWDGMWRVRYAEWQRQRHGQPDARQGCRTVDRACIVECSVAGSGRMTQQAHTIRGIARHAAADDCVTKRGLNCSQARPTECGGDRRKS